MIAGWLLGGVCWFVYGVGLGCGWVAYWVWGVVLGVFLHSFLGYARCIGWLFGGCWGGVLLGVASEFVHFSRVSGGFFVLVDKVWIVCLDVLFWRCEASLVA